MRRMKKITLPGIAVIFCLFCSMPVLRAQSQNSDKVNREFVMEATMLGYIAKDGTRNPVLKAKKGERVRITIVNGELMTHDVAMEKLKIKSKTLSEKGQRTSITFTASVSDVYYCTVPGHRAAGMVGKFVVTAGADDKLATSKGLLPQKDGKPVNLNFETGTLKDWTPTGDAFADPLINKDPSPKHDKDAKIEKEGKYFVSSGGQTEHDKTGTLTSVPFRITQPWAAFKVSGGALQDTRVELVLAKNDSVFFQIPGTGRATLRPVVVNLAPYLKEEMYIRLIDNETGVSPIPYIDKDKWAHLNFDDFEFYTKRPVFSNELKPSDVIVLPPLDVTQFAGLSGQKAAEAMTLPPGFSVSLAAAEPEIIKPIAFTIDWKGRLWVVESHNYPLRAPIGEGKDRIYIFEDTDGDGKLDSKKTFIDTLNLVSGIEVGLGGVWIGSAPHLIYIPIDDKTDKPAGPAEVILDGWGYEDTHETLNSLHFGPDGWLYGTHGVFTNSNVGRPGTSDAERVKMNGGVWRLHPKTKKFELYAEGTSNPWGIDWNDYGHAFITACVVEHLYQVIQGGRYVRQARPHPQYTFDDIKTMADHVHWIGNRGPHAGNFRSASKGGGHAHAGAMIYLGGDSWPAEYRNDIFMNNIHGSRVNIDHLVRKGSGYTGTHGNDFLLTNDAWSQWLNFRYGPTGSVYAIDWYDKNQCHSPNPDVHDKTMGRIFTIRNAKDQFVKVDLLNATDMELVQSQLNKNDWYVRQSRLILAQRGGNPQVHVALKKILTENPDVTRKLRALWALHVTNGISNDELVGLMDNESDFIRGWAIQLLAEDNNPSEKALNKMVALAKSDPSAMVRLYIASAMQRTPLEKRWEVVDALLQHGEDSADHNIPLMVWYAFEPLVAKDINRAVAIAKRSKLPNISGYTVKRLADIKTPESIKASKDLTAVAAKPEHHHGK
jgi:putative membrane-bound dehydrogenase-like protein